MKTDTLLLIGAAATLLLTFKNVGDATESIPDLADTEPQRGTLPVYWEVELLPEMNAPVDLDELYQIYGEQFSVPPLLLKAVATAESSENPSAENPNDPSYGLMQVLCQPDGNGGCRNTFPAIDGWPPVNKNKLFEASYNLFIGAQILSWNIDHYGFERGIAVYNRWASRNDPPLGPFGNQGYVDKVLNNYNNLMYQYWGFI